MKLYSGRFDEFVDLLIGMGKRSLLIVLDIDQKLTIPSNFQRSSVKYLYNSQKIDIIHIDTLQKLMVYLAKLEIEKQSGLLVIWELPPNDMICSKLVQLNDVILGFAPTTELSTFKRWI